MGLLHELSGLGGRFVYVPSSYFVGFGCSKKRGEAKDETLRFEIDIFQSIKPQ